MTKKAIEKKKEIKFPFVPNECVKAAFRQEVQLKRAIHIMTEAIAKVAADVVSPWEILKDEYPELLKQEGQLKYNQISETIEIEISDWKRRKF